MATITTEEVRERLGNIDQIRDIIFGAQIREYNGRLDKIETELSMLQQEVRDRMEQVKTSFASELKKAVDGLEKKLKTLNAATQEDRADLSQQIDRLSKKLSSNIEAVDEQLDTQIAAVQHDLAETRTKYQEDVSALRDLVLEELDRRFSQLREAKVSKDDLAETLFELGMRLKGAEFIPTLKEAADNGDGHGYGLALLEHGK